MLRLSLGGVTRLETRAMAAAPNPGTADTISRAQALRRRQYLRSKARNRPGRKGGTHRSVRDSKRQENICMSAVDLSNASFRHTPTKPPERAIRKAPHGHAESPRMAVDREDTTANGRRARRQTTRRHLQTAVGCCLGSTDRPVVPRVKAHSPSTEDGGGILWAKGGAESIAV